MSKVKLLIVEGNTKKENINFSNAGCVPQSENFKIHVKKIEPDCEIDIVAPGDDNSICGIDGEIVCVDIDILNYSSLNIAGEKLYKWRVVK